MRRTSGHGSPAHYRMEALSPGTPTPQSQRRFPSRPDARANLSIQFRRADIPRRAQSGTWPFRPLAAGRRTMQPKRLQSPLRLPAVRFRSPRNPVQSTVRIGPPRLVPSSPCRKRPSINRCYAAVKTRSPLTKFRHSRAHSEESGQIPRLQSHEARMRFPSAKKRFLTFCAVERRLSPHTIEAYKFDLLDFGRWRRSQGDFDRITDECLKEYLENMVSERELSPATVRRRLACLRSFFRYLDDLGHVKDPFAHWRPKLPKRRRLPRALARSESIRLFNADNDPARVLNRDREIGIIFRLLVATGLRVGELCTLRLSDISPDCSVLRVHGKGSRDRVIYIADALLRDSLAKIIVSRRLKLGSDVTLLTNRFGAPMRPQSVRSKLRRFAAEAGLERRVTPHMLRHTAATLLLETGVDIRFVQRLLGHSSIATTEIYTHVTDEALRATLERANILEGLRV